MHVIKITFQLLSITHQTGSVRDIQQSSRSWAATRGQDQYIVPNYLKVKWKSVTTKFFKHPIRKSSPME